MDVNILNPDNLFVVEFQAGKKANTTLTWKKELLSKFLLGISSNTAC